MRNLLRKPLVRVALVVAVLVAAVGLWAFQPWKVFTHSTIDEALPTGTSAPAAPAGSSVTAPPAAPSVLAEGTFVSQEHRTTGTARVLRLADGSRVLRLENFSTSDGPDVHVWLTDGAAGAALDSYDDGRYVRLGKMKATDGNQNYAIPADADLHGLRSVVIWCDRFNVAFGSAPLAL